MNFKLYSGNLKGRGISEAQNGWEDNFKMEVNRNRYRGVIEIHMTQKRDQWRDLVSTVMNLRVP